jgi:hypothetical protein
MPACAFCHHSAKLTGEHIWSVWMGELLKIKKLRFIQRDTAGVPINTFALPGLDLKAKVVCKSCNEGWMSNMESQHARPAMERLITGVDTQFTFSHLRANRIALFAFKTAVIIDHMSRGNPPFFCRSNRYRFAATGAIPTNVQMWFAGFLPMRSGRINADYREATVPRMGRLKLYICTYAIGHFVFQVVSAKYTRGIRSFSPIAGFEHLSIPFWPTLATKTRWPPDDVIRTVAELEGFSRRWRTVSFG